MQHFLSSERNLLLGLGSVLTLLLAGRELLWKLAPSESPQHREEQKHLTPWSPTILLNKVVILRAVPR